MPKVKALYYFLFWLQPCKATTVTSGLDEVTLTAGLNALAFGPADSTRATNTGSSSWSRGSVSQSSPFLATV